MAVVSREVARISPEDLLDDEGFEYGRTVFVNSTRKVMQAKLGGCPWGYSFALLWAHMAFVESGTASAIIDSACESPIEKVFARRLLLSGIRGMMRYVWQASCGDAMARIARLASSAASIRRDWPREDWFLWQAEVASQRGDDGKLFVVREDMFDMDTAIQCMPQASLLEYADGKTVRPDFLFWCRAYPDKYVAVECDGFDYHSDKQKFTSDRKRDRSLMAKGVKVLRYSGSEIWQNPGQVADDCESHLLAEFPSASSTTCAPCHATED